MNNVTIKQTANLGYSPRQTNAAFNNAMANAYANADPRFTAKGLDRPGVSRGVGSYSVAAAKGADSFVNDAAQAAQIPMADSYYNSMQGLGEQTRQMQFGQALAGLQQQASQADWWNRFNNMQGILSSLYR